MARKAVWAIAIIVVILVMAWGRVFISGHRARMEADHLMSERLADQAVGFYDRALHMYWPGSPDVARAAVQLKNIALAAEAEGDLEGALHAWRVLRSGLYAARGLYQPYADVVKQSEEKIAALVARQSDDPQMREKHLALLQKSDDPARGWSMLALLGFALWVGSAIAFIWRALTPDGKLLSRPALVWGALFAVGYAVWLIGLALA